MKFKNDKQRKAMFANMNKKSQFDIIPQAPPQKRSDIRRSSLIIQKPPTIRQELKKAIDQTLKESQPTKEQERILKKARDEIKDVTTSEKAALWIAKHRKAVGVISAVGIPLSFLFPTVYPASSVLAGDILFSGSGGILGGAGASNILHPLTSTFARKLQKDRKKQMFALRVQGLTDKQANFVIDSRILRAEHNHRQKIIKKTKGKGFVERQKEFLKSSIKRK